MLGIIWGVWHAPSFFISAESDTSVGTTVLTVAILVATAVSLAIIYSWLYNSTGGSPLIVAVLHGAYNGSLVMWDGDEWLALARLVLYTVLAVVIALVSGPTDLSHRRRVTPER